MSAQQTPSSTPVSLLRDYLATVEADLMRGISTEHTYRPALKALVQALDASVVATNEPTRIECGAPDFIVTRRDLPVGYIEAKDVGVSLDEAERSEQLERYRDGLSNLILTDYLEFRWYRDGERVADARIAYTGQASGKLQLDKDGAAKAAAMLGQFLVQEPLIVGKPEELARRMAAIARTIRDVIARALAGDRATGTHLCEQLESFRRVLIHDLSEDQFADMYAQTIAYGLFAARVNAPPDERFSRQNAAYDLPKTNPFLRQMFGQIAGPELDERITWAVDDLAELLARARMDLVLADFGKRTRQEDPVVHFYETFLKAYDPKMREARGVYYTPEPVVSYIVRSVDHILKTEFGLPDGLADNSMIEIPEPGEPKGTRKVHKVQILDPACGTGTFLAQVIETIRDTVVAKQGAGMWPGYVHDHLLPRLYGFELLMAPYAIAHLKLGMRLKETGYDIDQSERLKVFLTNSLEEAHEREHGQQSFFSAVLAEEADRASEVKRELPIMVILGNPPYSGVSTNMSPEAMRLVDAYRVVDGHPLGERKVWLQDDYVKFIALAQRRVESTGYGVVGLVTNHGYLDNPTFRGMRQSLLRTFDEIAVLDLHGSSKKREKSPDGASDANVFDIQQGVAIAVMARVEAQRRTPTLLRHGDVWGTRSAKYDYLAAADVSTVAWRALAPRTPQYWFVPRSEEFADEYQSAWSLTDALTARVSGVITARDGFVVGFNDSEITRRLRIFLDAALSDGQVKERLKLRENYSWRVGEARQALWANDSWESEFATMLYRPFDRRRVLFDDAVVWRTRGGLMRQMSTGRTLGLITSGQTKDEWGVLATRDIAGHKSVTAYDISSVFPIFSVVHEAILPDADGPSPENEGLRSNISPDFAQALSARLRLTMDSNTVTHYLYGVMYSPVYRRRYADFLKIDFPRIPLTSDRELFRELCRLGSRLVTLHLMEANDLQTITTYPVAGESRVEKVRYTEPGQGAERGRVWINPTQYFEDVPLEVWEFHVGGYQVCAKWLKDRKGRLLTYEDLSHYQYVVAALAETIALMREIDEAIEAHGGWPLK
jgi:predicted helicase